MGSFVKCIDTLRIAVMGESRIYIKHIDKQDYLGYLFYLLSDTKNLFILCCRNFVD